MISIIIPTLNEEKCLPKLLKCIKEQTYKYYEIIVADADSKDKTKQIARKFGCKVVKSGGLPAVGRNNGAKAAKGGILLFLDADSLIENNFLENAVNDMERRKLDAAGSYLYPLGNRLLDRFFFGHIQRLDMDNSIFLCKCMRHRHFLQETASREGKRIRRNHKTERGHGLCKEMRQDWKIQNDKKLKSSLFNEKV